MKNRVMRTDYPIRKIADDTYMISDFGIANCYLLIGEERALLIDCGLGIGDIKGAVEKSPTSQFWLSRRTDTSTTRAATDSLKKFTSTPSIREKRIIL